MQRERDNSKKDRNNMKNKPKRKDNNNEGRGSIKNSKEDKNS